MTTLNQLSPGMIISLEKEIYKVESSVKVTVAKGNPFYKTKLKNLTTGEVLEKSFKLGTNFDEVSVSARRLEYLYPEGKDFLFLDVDQLENVCVPGHVIGESIHYLKEGIQLKALFYAEAIFSVELPQFLELTVIKTEASDSKVTVSSATKIAILETGARITVPLFVEAGDIVKVDTHSSEYVQRV
ncbi:MAG: elongation factor P [Simkaniaceae bacterium]